MMLVFNESADDPVGESEHANVLRLSVSVDYAGSDFHAQYTYRRQGIVVCPDTEIKAFIIDGLQVA